MALPLDPSRLHDLISGRARGPRAVLLRALLAAAEVPFGWAVRFRNRCFDCGTFTVQRVGVPVISVGNITAGGTGKTPLVAYLAQWFHDRSVRVALVSRGYAAAGGHEANDEARELARQLPDIPHLQDPDRVAAARRALQQHGSELIVLDDGFQHRRIHRDLNIVLIDALQPFGYGHLLPRGLLREPLSGLLRADVIALSRADAIPEAQRRQLQNQVRAIVPRARWIEVEHRPHSLINARGETWPVERLRGRRVAALAGIGNPQGFFHTLEQLGCELVARRVYPDHFPYQPHDLAATQRWLAEQSAVDLVVCTGKDLVKIEATRLGDHPLLALKIQVHVTRGLDLLEDQLKSILGGPGRGPART